MQSNVSSRVGLVSIAAALGLVAFQAASQDEQVGFCPTPPFDQLCPEIPHDIPDGTPSQRLVDNFSWQSFVALNWSVNGSGDAAKANPPSGTGPFAWQTWMDPSDVFLPGGKTPSWASGVTLDSCARAAARAHSGFAKGSPALAAIAKHAEMGAVEEFLEAGLLQPIIDQHNNYAVFEIRLNRDAFTDIVDNKWYDATQQAKQSKLEFTGGAVDGPLGAMEIKIAWRVFPPNTSDEILQRYFVVEEPIFIPARHSTTGKDLCIDDVKLGMVGFHILHKTETRPQWIWSTFEQVDNIAVGPDAPNGLTPTFRNLDCTDCVDNQPPPLKDNEYLWEPNQDKGGYAAAHKGVKNIPTQATRVDQHATEQINQIWQQKLAGSPFEFYELISTQWPTDPSAGALGKPMPVDLSNVTMETYTAEISCVSCHYSALGANGSTRADFSFLLMRACPSNPDGDVRPGCL